MEWTERLGKLREEMAKVRDDLGDRSWAHPRVSRKVVSAMGGLDNAIDDLDLLVKALEEFGEEKKRAFHNV